MKQPFAPKLFQNVFQRGVRKAEEARVEHVDKNFWVPNFNRLEYFAEGAANGFSKLETDLMLLFARMVADIEDSVTAKKENLADEKKESGCSVVQKLMTVQLAEALSFSPTLSKWLDVFNRFCTAEDEEAEALVAQKIERFGFRCKERPAIFEMKHDFAITQEMKDAAFWFGVLEKLLGEEKERELVVEEYPEEFVTEQDMFEIEEQFPEDFDMIDGDVPEEILLTDEFPEEIPSEEFDNSDFATEEEFQKYVEELKEIFPEDSDMIEGEIPEEEILEFTEPELFPEDSDMIDVEVFEETFPSDESPEDSDMLEGELLEGAFPEDFVEETYTEEEFASKEELFKFIEKHADEFPEDLVEEVIREEMAEEQAIGSNFGEEIVDTFPEDFPEIVDEEYPAEEFGADDFVDTFPTAEFPEDFVDEQFPMENFEDDFVPVEEFERDVFGFDESFPEDRLERVLENDPKATEALGFCMWEDAARRKNTGYELGKATKYDCYCPVTVAKCTWTCEEGECYTCLTKKMFRRAMRNDKKKVHVWKDNCDIKIDEFGLKGRNQTSVTEVEEASMWSSNIFGNERDNIGEANFAGPCLLETCWRDS